MLNPTDLYDLVARYTAPAGGRFYRTLYGMDTSAEAKRIASMQEWEALPFVTKDALIAMPLPERSFVPVGTLDHLRASSGTSGKPPLFSPRTHVLHMEYRLEHHDFKGAFLAYLVPLMPHWHQEFQRAAGRNPSVVVYDPKHPRASVALAKAAGVDAFSVFVYHVVPLGEEMKRAGINMQIRLAEITGETCSHAQYQYIRETFPNATIVQSYNSSEVEDAHIGMPCKPIDGSEPLAVYHPKNTHYLEIVDPQTGAVLQPRAGVEGDLLVTAYPGPHASFPLIRFRIGDTVRVVSERCPHGEWSFTVLGRTDMDFLKIPGGVLRADEIGRVLRELPDKVGDQFELHCREIRTKDGVAVSPTLHVTPKEGVDLSALATDIAARLRVAPSYTYGEGVQAGRYAPLVCVKGEFVPGAKTKRIVHD